MYFATKIFCVKNINEILNQSEFSKHDIRTLLKTEDVEKELLFDKAFFVKQKFVGDKVYFRGLVEFSNVCSKDCLYCGIRSSNSHVNRYNLSDNEILEAAKFAYENNFGSLVLQSGEIATAAFANRVENLLKEIKRISNNELGITISVGEQSCEVYQRWYNAGAHRFLLRIEASNPDLYRKLHPENHSHENRLNCLEDLKSVGYQVGTGVMIGAPFQTVEDLADDILFMRNFNIDMVGMGPYIEHEETPLYKYRNQLWSIDERFQMALKMVAVLRLVMKDINIAAATALQAIDPLGREKAVAVGANVIMPNITPGLYRNSYALYQNKPVVDVDRKPENQNFDAQLNIDPQNIGYGEWGDSKHFFKRK